jgi:hypothetical protein
MSPVILYGFIAIYSLNQSSKRSSYKSLDNYSKPPAPLSQLPGSNVVNIVVAKNFNYVSDDIQVHMLQVSTPSGNLARQY